MSTIKRREAIKYIGAGASCIAAGKNLFARSWRKDFFLEHLFDKHEFIPKSEGVVTDRYKYLIYFEQRPVYEELYDLKNDPHEKNNLAKDKEHREILESLRARLSELREKAR